MNSSAPNPKVVVQSAAAAKTIHVAMSGGGTRAALASGGVNIALMEAKLNRRVAVASMTAVSGSAIMLTRLLIAGNNLDAEVEHGEIVAQVRQNVHGIWKHGFRQSFSRDLFLTFPLLLGWLLAAFAIGGSTTYPSAAASVVLAAALTPLAALIMRRAMAFDAMRGTRFGLDRVGVLEQSRWFGHEQEPSKASRLLPTPSVWFATVNLNRRSEAAHSPWEQLSSSEAGSDSDRSLPIGELAAASAAVPFHSQWVGINGEQHVDGGVLDNLGLSWATDRVEPEEQLLIVDASAPLRPPLLGRAKPDMSTGAFARYFGLSLLGVVAGIPVTRLPAETVGISIAVVVAFWTLVLTLVGLRAINGVLLDMILAGKDSLSTEFRALSAIQLRQSESALGRLDQLGITYDVVGLPAADRVGETPDFATKLTRLHPDTGREVVLHAYLAACEHVGIAPSDTTVGEIESWMDAGWRANIGQWAKRLARRLAVWSLKALARTPR